MSASATRAGDSAQVTVSVAVAPDLAFEIFTKEIDLWWRHGAAYRIAGRRRGQLHFEPGLGGRLFETFDSDGAGSRTVVTGTVVAWDPPSLLAFEWRGVNFKPEEKTLVEVCFAPSESGTMVTLRHSGWSALPDDHPARHGNVGAAFARMIGSWWGDLLRALREYSLSR